MKYIAIVTTIRHLGEARSLALALVESKLVASAQISEIESLYWWKDNLENHQEFRILFTTTREQYQAVESAIRERHPYELPAIHAFPLDPVYPPYGDWIGNNSSLQGISSAVIKMRDVPAAKDNSASTDKAEGE